MEKITVKVAYATKELQKIIELTVDAKMSIFDIIAHSQITNWFAELQSFNSEQIQSLPIGIYGKKIDPTTYILKNNDRIEIYRKLDKSPNQKRLNRQSNYGKN